MLRKFNTSDGIILTIGVAALVVGILVDLFLIRILCLLIVLGSAVLSVALVRVRRMSLPAGVDGINSRSHSQEQHDEMKKLVFDDFQSHTGDGFHVEEIMEESAHQEFRLPSVPAPSHAPTVAAHPAFAPVHPEPQPVIREFHIADFFDIDSDIYKGDPEPRTEFNFLMHKVLMVVKEVLFAHSVAFFWVNRDKGQMVLEARISDGANFITSRRFPIGHDLISKVGMTGQPELITEVNPVSEQELLPYYHTVSGVQSFAGVPVYFSKAASERTIEQPVGVIAVDSKAGDAFGPETLALLGQFTKLASALIKSYTDKYDLLLDSELLRSIRRLQERIRNNFSLQTIVQSLSEETSKLVSWDYLSVILYDERKHAWVAKKVTNRAHEGYLAPESAIDFPESVVGHTIRTNTHGSIDDLEMSKLPRYYINEKGDRKGSFVSVPISSLNKCYGALNVESRDKYNFSRQDTDMLYRLAENAASALEIFYMQEVISEYVIIDDITGMYSKKFFIQRAEEELQRADDSGLELSLIYLAIDKSADIANRFGKEGFERVMLTIAKAIRSSVRSYDIVGRYDGNRFGILLINTAANEAYLWAEKMRKSIAGLVINMEGKSFAVTVSAGVCGALEGMRKEELIGNTTTVLNRATEAGGNTVRVY